MSATTHLIRKKETSSPSFPSSYPGLQRMLIVFAALATLMLYSFGIEGGGQVVVTSFAETYVAVTTFVAGTLILLLLIERLLGFDTVHFMETAKGWELPMASLLGALPGCGGALVVVTQYVKGRISFGALIAVLTATMGDAAFLILAREPLTGLIIIAITFCIGWGSGILVNRIHGKDFLRPQKDRERLEQVTQEMMCKPKTLFAHLKARAWLDWVWFAALVPGGVCAVLYAFQVPVLTYPLFGGITSDVVFAVAALFCASLWAFFSGPSGREPPQEMMRVSVKRTIVDDTNFVTIWVVAAFLVFNMTVHILHVDLKSLFSGAYYYLPLIAILIGFLPGCGPQILVAAIYLSGLIPFSALLGNAIANDGDALFPALALAPRAALLATLYSAVPAVFVAYALLIFGY